MKINLVVTRIVEKAGKDTVKVEADPKIDTLSWSSVLNLEAKRGEFQVGDKIVVTVEKA